MALGKVYIIGVGPGPADLITLRGYRLLRSADVLIVDYLIPRQTVEELAPPNPQRTIIFLGDGDQRATQAEINELMLHHARAGKTVARLKSGDPFIFGRGREELEFLSAAGVPWQAAPGLSSATAGPAAAGLALTHRGAASSFAVTTGRRAGGDANHSLPTADTLVVLMGVAALPDIARQLQAQGWDAAAPCMVIERADQPWQRRVTGALNQIADRAQAAAIAAPALLVVGAAAQTTDPSDRRPVILYTGLDPTHFRSLGDILHWPALRIVRDEAGYDAADVILDELAAGVFDTVIFTSRVGVASFFEVLEHRRADARILAGAAIFVTGAGTAQSLAEHGVRADAAPAIAGSPGLLNLCQCHPARRVLLVQGSHAPRGLTETLQQRGVTVRKLALHRVEPNPELGRPLPAHDVIYFTSPSGAVAWEQVYGRPAPGSAVWCIGEATRKQLQQLGITAQVVDPHVS